MVQYNGLAKKDEGGNSSFRHTSFPPFFLLLLIYKLRSHMHVWVEMILRYGIRILII
jgi:hypothetical protein